MHSKGMKKHFSLFGYKGGGTVGRSAKRVGISDYSGAYGVPRFLSSNTNEQFVRIFIMEGNMKQFGPRENRLNMGGPIVGSVLTVGVWFARLSDCLVYSLTGVRKFCAEI